MNFRYRFSTAAGLTCLNFAVHDAEYLSNKYLDGTPLSFGDKLKRERERRKISLDQIAASTKIGTRYLQALEDEDIARLPGGAYNRGFLRAYAHFLALPAAQEAELVRDLNDACEPRPVEPTETTPTRPRLLKWLGNS